jgi:hypothetical protein
LYAEREVIMTQSSEAISEVEEPTRVSRMARGDSSPQHSGGKISIVGLRK